MNLEWKTQRGRSLSPASFLIAGIVNITPDSFSDGGKFLEASLAVTQALENVKQGADIIDFGAESTRPGSKDIGEEEEWNRLRPVLDELVSKEVPDIAVSIDTFRANTAEQALKHGIVTIINDVSGGTFEPKILDIVAEHKAGYVLGHSPQRPDVMQDAPYYANVVDEVFSYFEAQMNICVKKGIAEQAITLDPCIGFAKNLEHNLALMRCVDKLQRLGRPLYYGISRKVFLRDLFNIPTHERDALTQVTVALLGAKGVQIHRVHNVHMARQALTLVENIW